MDSDYTRTGISRRRLLACAGAGLAALTIPIRLARLALAGIDPFAALRSTWASYLSGGSINPSEPYFASAISNLNSTTASLLATIESGVSITSLWPNLPLGSNSANLTKTFSNLKTLALAYVTPGTNYTGSPSLSQSVRAGLDFMVGGPYAPTMQPYNNWWDWQIGSAHALEDTAVLMYSQLSSVEITNYCNCINAFVTSPSAQMIVGGGTTTAMGANLLDLCRSRIVAGMLADDSISISTAVSAISSALPFVMCGGNGLYADYSYLFHGGVAYTGTYGELQFASLAALSLLLAGSTWAITSPDMANWLNAVSKGLAPMVFNGLMLDSVRGRAISRYDESDADDGFRAAINLIRWAEVTSSSAQASDWRSIAKGWLQRNTLTTVSSPQASIADIALAESVLQNSTIAAAGEPAAHHQFPNMARAVHRQPGWAYSISMCSGNVQRFEMINGENLHGWHTGDGMGYLYLNCDVAQFNDAFWDTVDPYMLPGTTVDTSTLSNSEGAGTFPATTWVGGSVLNGTYGAVGMQMQAYSAGLVAVKSWFCLDVGVVALGAGVNSTSGKSVLTIVENRNLHSPGRNSLYINGTEQPINAGWSSTVSGVHSACITGVAGYCFLWPAGANNIQFALTERTGNWSGINQLAPTYLDNDTRPYLSIAFDHGADPVNNTYSYVILPNYTQAQTAAYAASPAVSVVSNTATAQAIADPSLGVTMANFFADGTAGPITVDAPASVSVRENAGELTIAVSDPTWMSATVRVDVGVSGYDSLVSASPGLTVLSATGGTVKLLAETGGSRGATFSVTLSTSGTAIAASTAILLSPTGDTYVRGGSYATDNFSTSATTVVKNSTSGYDRVTLLQFDTASVTGTVSQAVLWVNGHVADGGGTQTTLTAYELSSSRWNPSTVTFDTAPSVTTALGSGPVSDLADWVGLNVTSAVVTGPGAVTALGIWEQPTSTCLATILASEAGGTAQAPILEIITT